MSAKVLVVGANGALGSDLLKLLPGAVGSTHADFDIIDIEAARKFIEKVAPTKVVNTAAFHRVPECEDQYASAFEVNVIGVRNLASICATLGIHLCHISTDYVFDGTKNAPYDEEDMPAPLSIYAISKLAGEHALAAYGKDWSVVRSCGLYGEVPTRAKGGNFINAMLKLGQSQERVTVVEDEVVVPTYTHDLAVGIGALLAAGGQGVFHIANSGATNWYEFARVIFETCKLPAILEPTTAAHFQSKVQRPAYSILNMAKFEAVTGHVMPHWKDALLRHLAQLDQAE